MSSTHELSRLFVALRLGDLDAARAVAEGIAAQQEALGHTNAAQRLRSSLRSDGNLLVAPLKSPPMVIPDALFPVAPAPLKAVELEADTRAALEQLVAEQQGASLLAERGLAPRHKVLLIGPSGCGKSMVGAALGHELGLPVFSLRLEGLMGALLGQTAQRLHSVFRFAEAHPIVLIIDEVDTIGRQRGEQRELGELDRVVVTLMQELDWAKVLGLVVATSNFPSALDPALWRRFELTLELPLPRRAALKRFWKKRLRQLQVDADLAAAREPPEGSSYAEAELLALDLARQTTLNEVRRR